MATYALPDELNDYADAHTTPPPDHLRRLAEETVATQSSPDMLTSVSAGRLLELLAWALQARRALEIGTYTGHSALAIAAGMPEDGRVITCELDPERARFAREHIDASPYADRIDIRVGPALETIATLEGPFDLVFIDADKAGYPDYFHAALPLLSDRGVIVLDNMLRGGRVLDPDAGDDVAVTKRLNEELAADPRGIAVLLTVRDGMTVWRRA
jgi:caffeoyl-CoA O-methyltransferase